jgi:hypothetical protein
MIQQTFCVFQILSICICLHFSSGFCTLLNAKEKKTGVELGHGGPDLPEFGGRALYAAHTPLTKSG